MKNIFFLVTILIFNLTFSQKKFLDDIVVGDNIDSIRIGGFSEIKNNAECFNCKVFKIDYGYSNSVDAKKQQKGMIVDVTFDDNRKIIGLNRITIHKSFANAISTYDYQRQTFKKTYNSINKYKFISEQISDETKKITTDYNVYKYTDTTLNITKYVIRGRYENSTFYEEFSVGSVYKPIGEYKNVETTKKVKAKITQEELDLLKSICTDYNLNRNQCTCFMNKITSLISTKGYKNLEELFEKDKDFALNEIKKYKNECTERY